MKSFELGAPNVVYQSVLDDIEQQRLVPGQRLVEMDLRARFHVSRNVIREAMQRLEARGIVELRRHSSASIRSLSACEASDILDVAEAMLSLLAATAATKFSDADQFRVKAVLEELAHASVSFDYYGFEPVRRQFYRSLLAIAENAELERLLPAVSTPVLYAQYRSPALYLARVRNYRSILSSVMDSDPDAARAASRAHVAEVRVMVTASIAASAAENRADRSIVRPSARRTTRHA